MPLTQEEALAKLRRDSDFASDPALTEEETEQLLAESAIASEWAADTGYMVGMAVVPTTRNGHVYKCIQSGESGSTEPDFPESLSGQVTDNGCIWQEFAIDTGELWDVRKATCEAWMLKAARAATRTDFGSDNQNFKRSQLHQHCLSMAEQYRPIFSI